ncbi:unnamed protein product [Adineta steineri]|uniref:RNase NYN domain-containing protein n=1 Tax=Adineta steineri TaxID=433720 RepID=A0A814I4N8_9BILA|nr:unnamed protein product [Adineta steineri]CAF1009634.1 unnamed protein product [Adineta steineri]CAF1018899.1 unnamed protein product [Adineta steineri]
MSTHPIRNNNNHSQRRYRTNNNRQRPDKKINASAEQTRSDLIQQFNFYCASLHTRHIYDFDIDGQNNHRCTLTLSVFPNLQSIGNGGKSKQEAKANSIIAFLAHMEKRKQVGLFVPYLIPSLHRSIQVELRRAAVSTPDLNINANEYLLHDRIISKRQAKKLEQILRIIQRICGVRIVTLSQSSNMTFIYIVGAKLQQDLIQPYINALFQPDNEQMFNYGEKLFDIFSDETFLDNVCQRLKVLCDNHLEKCKLFIRGSSVNVQCCYNEFVILRREYENEFHRQRKNAYPAATTVSSNQIELKTTTEQLESTRIDNNDKSSSIEEKTDDQLPDYSNYDDDVNASILKVLRDEEDSEEKTLDQDATIKKSPSIIEISDDSSDSAEPEVLQTIVRKPIKKINHTPLPIQTHPVTTQPIFDTNNQNISHVPQLPLSTARPLPTRVLRHIVLDGQNVARNSNDYDRSFSWSRLFNAIHYFKNRGHENIIAFLPLYLRDYSNKHQSANDATRERQHRDFLINSRYIAFTPSRYNNGQRLTNYDDRFILQYAADNDGIVVSNDNFRDLQHEQSFQFIINHRILPFATINETFMPATDPLGRNGPHLDEFLLSNRIL